MLGKRDNRHQRSYVIAYIRPDGRRLYDSARTLDDAVARYERRVSKRYNRNDAAEVSYAGKLVLKLSNPNF